MKRQSKVGKNPELPLQEEEVRSLDEMKRVVLKRAKLEQWVDNPEFARLVRGVFVRVSVAGQYKLTEVADIKEDKEYELTKIKTNIVLLLSAGG